MEMPMNSHVTKLFLVWHEHKLDEGKRLDVEHHLASCDTCSSYFKKMSGAFTPIDQTRMSPLEANPHLPARIETLRLKGDRHARAFTAYGRWLQWSFAGIGVGVAVIIGITLGKELSGKVNERKSTDIVTIYYQAFSQNGFADNWDSVLNVEKGDSK
jgi:hypothetical protein